ncbi:MAG TPA: class I SAM-dependent methyltransferase [Bacillota bacterium]|nr:class I SAM-dependent methyltransferase [Bacillota bacterium]
MYRDFAYVYDELMQDVDYDRWADHIEKIFNRFAVKPEKIVDLACGTGSITNRLAARGYNMTGVDISQDMLSVAREKARKSGLNVPYIHQDIRSLDLHGPLDAVVCMCDGLNYIIKKDALRQVLCKAREYLKPGGVLLFDISSYYKLSQILGNNIIVDTEGDTNLVWCNSYSDKSQILQMDLTFYVRQGDYFRRFYETHLQRAYKSKELKNLLVESGFSDIALFSDFGMEAPDNNSQRIFFYARK